MKAASSAAVTLHSSSYSFISFHHRSNSAGFCRATSRRFILVRKASLSATMSSEASTFPPAEAQATDRMGDGVGTVKQQISRLFESSLKTTFPDEGNMEPMVVISTQKFADYQCNNAMSLFSKIKGKSAEYKNPNSVGQAIARNVPQSDMIESTSVAGPGFVNIVLSNKWVAQNIESMLVNGIETWAPLLSVKRAVVDFSSPNIAKEMHVGHLRSTIIGDTLARMLEFSKVDVLRRNHVGDWGTQFGMLIESLFEMFPNWEDAADQAIGDLQEFYKASKKRFDDDPSFKERAQLAVVQLQSGETKYRNAWKKICEISRKEFDLVYKRLGVHLEEKGESFYNPYIPGVLEELTNKGLVEESEGARVIFIEGQSIPLIVVKKDGGFNYASTDLAAIWYRLNIEKAEWMIYLTDSGQQQHFSMVFSAARLAGWLPEDSNLYPKASHVGLGLVLGSDGKRFRTRSSEVVRLAELLDEAKDRSKAELKARLQDNGKLPEWTEKELEETAEAVGYGAVKYADLKNNRTTNYTFSFEQMLNDKVCMCLFTFPNLEFISFVSCRDSIRTSFWCLLSKTRKWGRIKYMGNTAVYLLYAHARICSITRRSGKDIEELKKIGTIVLGHADERILGLHLIHFAEIVEEACTNLLPNVICEYLYNLSEIFTRFYTNCKGSKTVTNLDLQVVLHYGIPYTASILAFDPIQGLLAVGTLDGRIKIIGGDNIEGLLISPRKLPYKNLEFLHNRGFLLGVSNDNDIQVWDLECRRLAYSLQWETNITAFAVIHGTYLMYIGDENGLMSVLRYDSEEGKLLRLPYNIPAKAIIESAGISCPNHQSIVGILPQPSSSGRRVLIAYESGLIILWDVSEAHVVAVRGYTELQLKGEGSSDHQTDGGDELEGNAVDQEQEEKEICSLCWVSDSGVILAVGYVNGDILLWDISSDFSKKQQVGSSSKAVVKLQLASGNRRLPVIILKWSANAKANDKGGQLLIYGGDDMGSEEVLTVLNLEWSSGIDSLRCVSRVDLNLNGSFADMILIPSAGATEHNSTAALFVLTNPGQLNVYDGSMLPILKTEEGKLCLQAEKFPVVVPTIDPFITVTKFCLLIPGRDSSKDLFKKASAKGNLTPPTLPAGTRWPLTGGVPSESFLSKANGVERIYISGYQDGSVRIWDATCPILTLMFILEGKIEIPGIEVDNQSASVSALDFCPTNMSLAVGNERGLVCIYKLHQNTNGLTFHLVSETKHEVHTVQLGEGYQCIAAFIFSNSSIQTLKFAHAGEKLALGFETGQVAMLDMSSLSIMFHTDSLSGVHSPITSIAFHVNPQNNDVSPKKQNVASPGDSAGVILILTKDTTCFIIDSINGKIISSQQLQPKNESAAISMYVIDEDNSVQEIASETFSQHPSDENSSQTDSQQRYDLNASKPQEIDQHYSADVSQSSELLSDPLFLLCCEDSLWLCSLKSVKQGNCNFIHKASLAKHCCWSATFKKRDQKGCALILLYQTGDLEMRSLPDLEVLAESSIMSTLRWSFKTNMENTISSYENGQITMVNGCELAFISFLACENDYRIPESLPCLHDKVVAAAADAAITLSMNQKKRQGTAPGILGGFLKGLKGGKAENDADCSSSFDISFEDFFYKDPFVDPLATAGDKKVELSIDDVKIDDVLPVSSSSSIVNKQEKTNENTEREKLFGGSDAKPRVRTTQEIMTQYKFGGDAAAAAAHARNKLNERQEKLERISQRTAELQDGAQNFAEMANELARTMEKKKWWKK